MTKVDLPGELECDELERNKGILNETDREFLWGQKEYQHRQTAYNRERDIREHFREGIRDLVYLPPLDDGNDAKVFDELDQDELHKSVSKLIEWIYVERDGGVSWLESAVARGVANGEGRRMGNADIAAPFADVDITPPKSIDLNDVEERWRGDGSVSNEELGLLLRSGRLNRDDFEDIETDGLLFPESSVDVV